MATLERYHALPVKEIWEKRSKMRGKIRENFPPSLLEKARENVGPLRSTERYEDRYDSDRYSERYAATRNRFPPQRRVEAEKGGPQFARLVSSEEKARAEFLKVNLEKLGEIK